MTQFDDTVISIIEGSAQERRCPSCNIEVPAELERCPQDGTRISETPRSELDARYELLEPIGKGGMSVVYKARHRLIGNLVAIKLLQDKLTDNTAHIKRFQVEAQAAARLDHTNLIKVHDFGALSSGFTFLVMDLADGRSLADIVRNDGPIEGKRALRLFMQICEGLAHAHSKGILHRDLKPSNVIVVADPDSGEKAKVVDFGIAKVTAGEDSDSKLTATGEVFGSPHYMSPEQCTGSGVDQRSDVYSMGCLMYEVLSGRLPVSGANLFEIIHRQVSEVPEPLSKHVSDPVAVALSDVVAKTLEKDPAARYQSFNDLLDDLRAVAEGRSLAPQRRPRLTKTTIGIALGVIALAGAVAGIAFVSQKPAQPPAPQVIQAPVPNQVVVPRVINVTEPERKTADLPFPTNDRQENRQWHEFPRTHRIQLEYRNLTSVQMAKLAADKQLDTIVVPGNAGLNDAAVELLRNHPELDFVNLTGTSITNASLPVFATMPKLNHLAIGHTKITSEGFPKLADIRKLSELWVNDLDLTDADLEKLPAVERLKRLKIDDNPRLTNQAVKIIARKFPNLQFLSFRRVPLTEAGFEDFKHLSNLREIRPLQSNMQVARLNELAGAAGLKVAWDAKVEPGTRLFEEQHRLLRAGANTIPPEIGSGNTVGGAGLTSKQLIALANIRDFTTLNIRNASNVDPRALLAFRFYSPMKWFCIDNTHAGDIVAQLFPTMQNLQHAHLINTGTTSKSFAAFAHCPKLNDLWMRSLKLNAGDIAKLPELSIHKLNIGDNPQFDDAALRVLVKKIPQVESLTLDGTGITDGAIPELLKLSYLTDLDISRTQISSAGLAKLRARRIDVQSDRK